MRALPIALPENVTKQYFTLQNDSTINVSVL